MARVRIGYTLFEMVLVMLLIVAAAAITIPALESMLAPNRIRASSDLIRAQWADMRGKAMHQGRAYRFRVKVHGSEFLIEPEEGEENIGNPEEKVYTFQGELPEQVVFLKGASDLVHQAAAPASAGNWETVLIYLPDGTAREDTTVYFGLPKLRAGGLEVRALTGAVSVVEPLRQEEQP